MARRSEVQRGAKTPNADRRALTSVLDAGGEARMARFAADSRLSRLLVIGGLVAVGWLLGVIFGVFGTATAVAEAAPSHVAAGSVVTDDFPTASADVSVNTEAMAGRNVDGLTSQSKPAFPPPSTADHTTGSNGFVPQTSGGSLLFGEVARSTFDPRPTELPTPIAAVLPPVFRTAADDPSFSPD